MMIKMLTRVQNIFLATKNIEETSKKFSILETKSGIKIKLRTNSTDLMALTHVWLIGEYKRKNFEINPDDEPKRIG